MILRQEPDADPWCSQTPVSQKEIGSARVFIGKTKGPPRGVSFGHIAAQKLVRPLRILGSGVDPINSSRPMKMPSGPIPLRIGLYALNSARSPLRDSSPPSEP